MPERNFLVDMKYAAFLSASCLRHRLASPSHLLELSSYFVSAKRINGLYTPLHGAAKPRCEVGDPDVHQVQGEDATAAPNDGDTSRGVSCGFSLLTVEKPVEKPTPGGARQTVLPAMSAVLGRNRAFPAQHCPREGRCTRNLV